jgi:hypothetical protein
VLNQLLGIFPGSIASGTELTKFAEVEVSALAFAVNEVSLLQPMTPSVTQRTAERTSIHGHPALRDINRHVL